MTISLTKRDKETGPAASPLILQRQTALRCEVASAVHALLFSTQGSLAGLACRALCWRVGWGEQGWGVRWWKDAVGSLPKAVMAITQAGSERLTAVADL